MFFRHISLWHFLLKKKVFNLKEENFYSIIMNNLCVNRDTLDYGFYAVERTGNGFEGGWEREQTVSVRHWAISLEKLFVGKFFN